MNLVDLIKSFATRTYLENRRRYSRERVKFGGDSIHFFIRLLTHRPSPSSSESGHVPGAQLGLKEYILFISSPAHFRGGGWTVAYE